MPRLPNNRRWTNLARSKSQASLPPHVNNYGSVSTESHQIELTRERIIHDALLKVGQDPVLSELEAMGGGAKRSDVAFKVGCSVIL
jgi:hypothetical protein